ncbi:MAG TPA: M48 family metallopeptidase [Candidatus Baltobacteraceae bacterium]|jgi:predicted Zn-dependent protease|nr:M48 family metallopeptidase [Candidatus Baltobacteraceae bacterium]
MQTIARLAAAAAATIGLLASMPAPALAYDQQQQWEMQIGQQEYQQLQQQGVIVTSSPYYKTLDPIAKRISSVANAKYFVPFHFILVKDSQPNAFAVPGGNVYVTTAMMSFAQNQEELAGVLCHETSHDIHHDVYNLAQKDQNLQIGATLIGLLVGRSNIGNLAVNFLANAQAMNFSRSVESNADHLGAYTCAQAGYNPWGMVWLFQRFESKPSGVPLEMLSDHPRDDHRVSDLEDEFRNDPGTFARFASDKKRAHPL